MRMILPRICCIAFVLLCSKAYTQCDFKPVIVPRHLILCPDEQDTLFTTENYDSYQWYKENQAIEGATLPYLLVNQYDDAAYNFYVVATLNGCSAKSKKVLVDGYAFVSPYTITSGDAGIFDPNTGLITNCVGDKVVLAIGNPYSTNVQWYNNFEPIDGATSQEFIPTLEQGSYTVCGSPAVCPDYVGCNFISVDIAFRTPETPVVTQSNDTLFSTEGKRYIWYRNGAKIEGAKENYYVPAQSGKYAVSVRDEFTCVALSEIYKYKKPAAAKHISDYISFAPNPVQQLLRVQVKSTEVTGIIISDVYGHRLINVNHVQNNQTVSVQKLHTGTYVLQVINKEGVVMAAGQLFKQ